MATLCHYAAVFGIKMPTTKHAIMLHAMSLKRESRTSTNCSRILTAWNELDERVIDDTAVRQWRMRLRARVKAKDGQFELKLSE